MNYHVLHFNPSLGKECLYFLSLSKWLSNYQIKFIECCLELIKCCILLNFTFIPSWRLLNSKVFSLELNFTWTLFFTIRRIHIQVFLDGYMVVHDILLNTEFILTINWQPNQQDRKCIQVASTTSWGNKNNKIHDLGLPTSDSDTVNTATPVGLRWPGSGALCLTTGLGKLFSYSVRAYWNDGNCQ